MLAATLGYDAVVGVAIVFMWMGILSGFAYGYSPSKIATEFVKGAKGMISAALIVGLGAACIIMMVCVVIGY